MNELSRDYTWPPKACPCGSYQRPECFNTDCKWVLDPSLVPAELRRPLPSPRLTLRQLASAVRSAASLQVQGEFGDRMELTLRDIARQLDEHASTVTSSTQSDPKLNESGLESA